MWSFLSSLVWVKHDDGFDDGGYIIFKYWYCSASQVQCIQTATGVRHWREDRITDMVDFGGFFDVMTAKEIYIPRAGNTDHTVKGRDNGGDRLRLDFLRSGTIFTKILGLLFFSSHFPPSHTI